MGQFGHRRCFLYPEMLILAGSGRWYLPRPANYFSAIIASGRRRHTSAPCSHFAGDQFAVRAARRWLRPAPARCPAPSVLRIGRACPSSPSAAKTGAGSRTLSCSQPAAALMSQGHGVRAPAGRRVDRVVEQVEQGVAQARRGAQHDGRQLSIQFRVSSASGRSSWKRSTQPCMNVPGRCAALPAKAAPCRRQPSREGSCGSDQPGLPAGSDPRPARYRPCAHAAVRATGCAWSTVAC